MMAVTDWLVPTAMAPVGFLLGLVYFRGLWATVKALPAGKSIGVRMAASFIVRLLLLMFCFYLLMGNDWKRLIGLTFGFWCSRLFMVRRYGDVKPAKTIGQAS